MCIRDRISTSSSTFNATQNLVGDVPGQQNELWITFSSPVGKDTLRTAQMIRAVSLPPFTLQADDPFTMLFNPFPVGCAVHHSKSCSCEGSTSSCRSDPKCFTNHSSNVVPSFCSLHGAPVPINEIKRYGDFAMAFVLCVKAILAAACGCTRQNWRAKCQSRPELYSRPVSYTHLTLPTKA